MHTCQERISQVISIHLLSPQLTKIPKNYLGGTVVVRKQKDHPQRICSLALLALRRYDFLTFSINLSAHA